MYISTNYKINVAANKFLKCLQIALVPVIKIKILDRIELDHIINTVKYPDTHQIIRRIIFTNMYCIIKTIKEILQKTKFLCP